MSTIDNPPGLAQLSYRARTYATSLAEMLSNLRSFAIPSGPNTGTRPLAALTTRASDDPTIAFLDAWAIVIDVLTFYQERIANEGYLRTATEVISLIELAGAIGYQLNPGLAATAALAFVIEDAAGAPGTAVIPVGTQVQSVPVQGQLPQVFETTAAISARAEWNALELQQTQLQQLPVSGQPATAAPTLTFSGTSLALQPGALLWVAGQNEAVNVAAVTVDPVGGTTEVTLFDSQTVAVAQPPAPPPSPEWPLTAPLPLALTSAHVTTWILDYSWQAPDLDAFLLQVGWDPGAVADMVAALTAPVSRDVDGVCAFGQRAAFLGRTISTSPAAPTWSTTSNVTIETGTQKNPGPTTTVNVTTTPASTGEGSQTSGTIATDATPTGSVSGTSTTTGGTTIGGASSGGRPVGPVIWWKHTNNSATVLLERSVTGITPGSTVVFVDTTWGTRLPKIGYSVISAVDQLATLNGSNITVTALTVHLDPGQLLPSFPVTGTVAYVQSIELPLAPTVPLPSSSATLDAAAASVVLDRMALGLESGQLAALTGQRTDTGVTQTEIVALSGVLHAGGYTTLTFAPPLQTTYASSTVTLNANVAPATHGQTVAGEVLGSGDGSQQNQTFVLAKPNLTYVPSPTGSGGQDTLSVRVNGVLWQEAPSLFGEGAQSRTYMIRTDDEANTSVIFGDGQSGARVPTGQENVTVTYRTGLGPAGNVASGALSLLFNRPLGVRSVQNPLAASGGVAPQGIEDARAAAPLTVRTLDRIVTLSDYEDFARDFPAIGKAQATELERAGAPVAHLTVAAVGGAALSSGLVALLQAAIAALVDPSQESIVDPCNIRYFGVTATLGLLPGSVATPVIVAAQSALASAFGFAKRSFGQSVRAAEVLVVLQNVPGVVGVQMQPLTFTDHTGDGNVLVANPARWAPDGSGRTVGADLILFSPTSTVLTSPS